MDFSKENIINWNMFHLENVKDTIFSKKRTNNSIQIYWVFSKIIWHLYERFFKNFKFF
jgi:hypothetical protein